jgi:hypothetical protein
MILSQKRGAIFGGFGQMRCGCVRLRLLQLNKCKQLNCFYVLETVLTKASLSELTEFLSAFRRNVKRRFR